MKQTIIALITLLSITLSYACKKKTNPVTAETENMNAALMIDQQMSFLHVYHDSVWDAHLHNPGHVHHYDSIFHHHDSLYHHHHHTYHHGDTAHHHTGWHHTLQQHQEHDSLVHAHDGIFH